MKDFKKYVEFLLGIFIMSFGAVLASKTNVGVAPWDAINFGLSKTFGIMSTGRWIIFCSLIALIIAAFIEKKFIKITSFITSIIIGLFIDFWIYVLNPLVINGVLSKYLIFVVALVIVSIGLSIYLFPNLPAYPIDHLMVVFKNKFNLKIMHAKLLMDGICVIVALLFKGPVGIGTISFALLMGPGINLWQSILGKYLKKFIS
ncbi:hypothetical protein [Clostridium oceanicum]|uniref:YitT family protein n=1 Tax=Clostridium oceanicum TaxID=1543 RepID=A0ABN1JAN7_9CLOT